MRTPILACCLAAIVLVAPVHAQLAPQVSETALRAHMTFMADDLFEGRGTGQRGGDLAVRYLETQAQLIGLKPMPSGSYLQPVAIEGTKLLPGSSMRFRASGKEITAEFGKDIVFGTKSGKQAISVDAPLLFVGYGVSAPEERWDDYKGVDVKGKILVMMVDDPQPTAEEPQRFAGKAYTWYGRWVYKFEEAARRGAAGVLLIHTTPSAAYAWTVPATSFAIERFSLKGNGNPVEGWLHEDLARKLFAAGGHDLDTLRATAERRDFRPVELKVTGHAEVRSAIRPVEQFNVVGIVPGTDPVLKEQAVVYSAHWDHLGMIDAVAGEPQRDRILNGAIDNASGVAALLAMATEAVKQPARRTQVFLWPAAEEQGLLGATAYVNNPVFPLAKTAANLNLDSMNFVGRTLDIGVPGAERTSLYGTAGTVAKAMGLRLAPTIADMSGAYYRADHFPFARSGVPAFTVGSAVFSGDGYFTFERDQQASSARMKAFKQVYHKVNDEVDPRWDLSGMVQQTQFTFNLGYAVANAPEVPTWNKGDPFASVKR